ARNAVPQGSTCTCSKESTRMPCKTVLSPIAISSHRVVLYCLMLSPHFHCQAFQIGGLRNGHHLRMVQSLAQALAHYELAPGVVGGLLHHALEACALDVVGAGKRHQHATRLQQLEGTQVDFFVATQGLGEGIATVGERGRIEYDQVKLLTTPLELAQAIEDI